MKILPYTLAADDDDASPAIGLVILQSDETMEHELRHLLPDSYHLFHTRVANSQYIDEHSLQAMQARLPESVSLLPTHTTYRVIAYGCTSASTVMGEAAVATAIQGVFANCKVTNPITAIKAQLANIEARRIALLTPYEPDVCKAIITNLQASGYMIVHEGSFQETQDHNVARISRASLLDAIDTLSATRDIDALVVSCTNLRTIDLLELASESIGCTVISSNSALAWHIRSLVDS